MFAYGTPKLFHTKIPENTNEPVGGEYGATDGVVELPEPVEKAAT